MTKCPVFPFIGGPSPPPGSYYRTVVVGPPVHYSRVPLLSSTAFQTQGRCGDRRVPPWEVLPFTVTDVGGRKGERLMCTPELCGHSVCPAGWESQARPQMPALFIYASFFKNEKFHRSREEITGCARVCRCTPAEMCPCRGVSLPRPQGEGCCGQSTCSY